jgi:hypothetical protein
MPGLRGTEGRLGVIPENALAFIRDLKGCHASALVKIPDTARAPFRDEVRKSVLSGIAILLFAAIAGAQIAPPAFAEESDLVPHPPKGRGEHCVADTGFMRRYHMTMMKHQRDETVHEGIRGGKFSLKGCVDCHAVKGTDGLPVSYENPKHFCRSCHDYEAVSIDCFECHASKPDMKPQAATADAGAARSETLANYLQESHP